jgi:hypothetical protein
MIDLEIQLVRQNPACLLVLQAYQAAFDRLREEASAADSMSASISDSDRSGPETDDEASEPASRRGHAWITRLPGVIGVDDEELSWVHGQLIAYGLLKCDLRDRSAGVVYQLTPEARQVLEAESNEWLSAAA